MSDVVSYLDPSRARRQPNGYTTHGIHADDLNAQRVAEEIEQRWRCHLHRLPDYHAIDYYAERDGFMVASIEVKCRPFSSDRHPRILIKYQKILTLTAVEGSSRRPGVLVYGYTDRILWTHIARLRWDGPPFMGETINLPPGRGARDLFVTAARDEWHELDRQPSATPEREP